MRAVKTGGPFRLSGGLPRRWWWCVELTRPAARLLSVRVVREDIRSSNEDPHDSWYLRTCFVGVRANALESGLSRIPARAVHSVRDNQIRRRMSISEAEYRVETVGRKRIPHR